MSEDYDFIVGFTIFGRTGFKTMYRHFDKLESAKLFASNINIKDNCKMYVDLDLYNKEKGKNKEQKQRIRNLECKIIRQKEQIIGLRGKWHIDAFIEEDYISKDKIREKIEELNKEYEEYKEEQEWEIQDDIQAQISILQSLLEE